MLVWCVDDAPFEGQQEQDFEDAVQQQRFEEGKWPLDHTFVRNWFAIVKIVEIVENL